MTTIRRRLREHGLVVGTLPTGPLNALTDVEGVQVGHLTLWEAEGIRTGVTAILPHSQNTFQNRVPAQIVVGNGYGKLAGSTQVQELGELETPIVLTNTLSVAAGLSGLIEWTLNQPGNEKVGSVNALVSETNDGLLNDIRARVVQPGHVLQALQNASPEAVPEGNVGAGTGTVAFGFKGGIGSSSRVLPAEQGGFTVGVLVQSNFGGALCIGGVPVGELLKPPTPAPDGSIMLVVATDAPLSDRNLGRLARRALLGVGRTGGWMANGSGDYVIAFSTAESVRRTPLHRTALAPAVADWPNELMTPLFQAVIEASEEAILNSLFMAQTMTGYAGRTVEALPLERVLAHLGVSED